MRPPPHPSPPACSLAFGSGGWQCGVARAPSGPQGVPRPHSSLQLNLTRPTTHLRPRQIVFSKLGRKEVRAIADIMLAVTVARVAAKG